MRRMLAILHEDDELIQIVTDLILDLTHLRCPLPLIEVKRTLKKAQSGVNVRILLSDAGSIQDIPKYLIRQGFNVTNQYHNNQVMQIDLIL